jgi:hypothetical protein
LNPRNELKSAGKERLLDALQGFLLGGEDASYRQTANALGLSLAAVKTTIHRLRGRYRALLREEVARTVATSSEVDEELRFPYDCAPGLKLHGVCWCPLG